MYITDNKNKKKEKNDLNTTEVWYVMQAFQCPFNVSYHKINYLVFTCKKTYIWQH